MQTRRNMMQMLENQIHLARFRNQELAAVWQQRIRSTDVTRDNQKSTSGILTKTAVVLHQHGAGTKQFVGDTSSVLWPVARHLCNYLCDRVKILRQEQCEEQLNVNGDEGGSCHADRLVDGVKIPALRKMVAGSSSEEDHVKLKQERDQKVRCIELGTGTGLVGIVLAHLGAEVVLTDQTLDLARENIELQPEKARARLNARELVWGETALDPVRDRHGYDLVVASDVICHQGKEVMQVLVATISSLLSRSSEARALVAYEFRDDWWTCSTFCDLCAAQGLQLTSLSLEPDDEDSDFILYVLRHDTSDAKQGAE
ncbi:unnamed protein product [Amoebophrya sp. A120]|nr:unnamed protein product [Amoebophrya sp. A120]|eukprot:GSA120T00020333001.1